MNYLVEEIVEHGAGIREFWLVRADGQALAPWQAGAHLELTLPAGRRHYSLVGEPEQAPSAYRFAVQQEVHGQGGSQFMHEQVQAGHVLAMQGPFNTFALQEGTPGRTVLIAGGIGITPICAMAHALSARGIGFDLHYLARTRAKMIFLEELQALPGAQVHAYCPELGTAHPALAPLLGPYTQGDALYACGPSALLQAIRADAAELGWPSDALHFESFGARAQVQDAPLSVHLAQSGQTLSVAPGTSILDALIDAGAFVSFDCKRGECGYCYTPVIEGQPEHRDLCLDTDQRRAGMCTCVSWASSATLVLDL